MWEGPADFNSSSSNVRKCNFLGTSMSTAAPWGLVMGVDRSLFLNRDAWETSLWLTSVSQGVEARWVGRVKGRTKAAEAMGWVSSGVGGFVCMNHIHGFTKC